MAGENGFLTGEEVAKMFYLILICVVVGVTFLIFF